MTFTDQQKRKAVERELRYRRYVYPNRVAEGRMRQQAADEQIAVMEAIAADYAERERAAAPRDLFGEGRV